MTNTSDYRVFLPYIMNQRKDEPKLEHRVFLPLITNGQQVAFRIDHMRLWSASENGAYSGMPCGNRNRLQIHVFSQYGDTGSGSRLNHVKVEVLYTIQGRRVAMTALTGENGMDPGKAEFPLSQDAQVWISADVDGRTVKSDTAFVTTNPLSIKPDYLIRSGFCKDEADCQEFVASNKCDGNFSWNVVFKRSN